MISTRSTGAFVSRGAALTRLSNTASLEVAAIKSSPAWRS